MSDTLNFVEAIANQIQRWPAAVLLFFCLIVLGWVLKVTAFPNKLIPASVLVAGSFINVLIGDVSKVEPTQRNPQIILAMWGVCIGFMAWGCHGLLLKKLEKYVPMFRVKGDGDTTFVTKDTIEPPKK